ncbi:MAG TPA: dual specificity protein phosphatase [Terriglobales bacterium]|nr:dual specificity protein phosphatase [Terriglobales bacterium]
MKVSEWSKVAQGWSLAAGRWSAALGNRGELRGWSATSHKTRPHGTFMMDMTWVTGRIAVGGGIWSAENMAQLARTGVTHIIDMQIEFDDTPLAEPHGITVLWNPIDDDFQPKSPDVFQCGVDFALEALDEEGTKLFVHCAAGVHRAPMMTLAILCSLGWELADALQLIEVRRPVVDFADVYVNSVKGYLQQQVKAGK